MLLSTDREGKTESEIKTIIQANLMNLFVCKCYGIIGFPIFLDGYYFYLITGRKIVASIKGQNIYAITKTRLEAIISKVKYIKNLFFFSI